jgi:hypothetical protein
MCQLELQLLHLLTQLLLLLLQRCELRSRRLRPRARRHCCHLLVLPQHRQLAPLPRAMRCCCCRRLEVLPSLFQCLLCCCKRLLDLVKACGSLLCELLVVTSRTFRLGDFCLERFLYLLVLSLPRPQLRRCRLCCGLQQLLQLRDLGLQREGGAAAADG